MNDSSVFGENGRLAEVLDSYEPRDVQVRMCEAVEKALEGRRHAVIEAGTGVGKSLAYLVPMVRHALDYKEKVVISTHTISLQEQLMGKDIPLVEEVLGEKFNTVLAKGRTNFVCPRRLENTARRHEGLFSSMKEVDELWKIQEWAARTKDGSLTDYPGTPAYSVWSMVSSDPYHCPGKSCARYEQCFYQKMRRRLYFADVIVVNHALFFTHLKLEDEGGSFFPPIGAVVLDEAHTVEGVASEHLGINLTQYSLERLLSGLKHEKTGRGLLSTAGISGLDDALATARRLAIDFFKRVDDWYSANERDSRLREKGLPSQEISSAFMLIADRLKNELPRFKETDFEPDLEGYVRRAIDTGFAVSEFSEPAANKNMVYWVERRPGAIALRSAPIHVGSVLSDMLWNNIQPVVSTSATLAVGKERSFEFYRERLGLDEADEVILGSTFDFRKQVKLYVETKMPDPRSDSFPAAVADRIKKYVERSEGRAFVLFTSYSLQDRVFADLEDWFRGRGMNAMKQGGGLSRSAMLREFVSNPGSVLFGTASFWQGVDVPGSPLSNVIITRLPFSVPSTPLALARKEDLEKRGLSYFKSLSLPEAVLRFKQGFGRLVRSRRDTGMVVVLDSRIHGKNYGRTFMESIPQCDLELVR